MSRTSRQGTEVSHRKGPSSERLTSPQDVLWDEIHWLLLPFQQWGNGALFQTRVRNYGPFSLKAEHTAVASGSIPWETFKNSITPMTSEVCLFRVDQHLFKKKKDLKCVPKKICIISLLEKKQRKWIPTCCGTWHVTAYGRVLNTPFPYNKIPNGKEYTGVEIHFDSWFQKTPFMASWSCMLG